MEDCVRTGKSTGLGRFPSHDFAINTVWLTAAMTAAVLLAWLKLLALDGALARAEPKTLRYRVLHTAARLVRPESKAGKNRVHLDVRAAGPRGTPKELRCALVDAEAIRLTEGGAKHVRTVEDEMDYFAVMQDPEGNEFCIC